MPSVAPQAELLQERDQLVEGEASKKGGKKEYKKYEVVWGSGILDRAQFNRRSPA
jgi:hypothetical protein